MAILSRIYDSWDSISWLDERSHDTAQRCLLSAPAIQRSSCIANDCFAEFENVVALSGLTFSTPAYALQFCEGLIFWLKTRSIWLVWWPWSKANLWQKPWERYFVRLRLECPVWEWRSAALTEVTWLVVKSVCVVSKCRLIDLLSSSAQVMYGAGFVELYAEEAKRIYGDIIQAPSKDKRMFVLRQVRHLFQPLEDLIYSNLFL